MLNGHLFSNLSVINSPRCMCGHGYEDPNHYFLECPVFHLNRVALLLELARFQPIDIDRLLYGDSDLPIADNLNIFEAVQKFIRDTGRFARA